MDLSTVQRQQAVLAKAVATGDGPGGVDLQGLAAGECEGEGPAAILGRQRNEGGPESNSYGKVKICDVVWSCWFDSGNPHENEW